ncbi:hypothetical protein OG298_05415 [Streptomyces sp. NBC_01005]|uniref:hypothetical protein n=1 Tax=unclassified Streptomyces TaxID=2593676 RepID=UPI003869064B|nr:hypothetical protein OG298_05415 [Streptomyces sp. NBC_01005]WTC93328.1 hypothetical protein OH736_05410 [Streptomyces sp. NBC_01650]
MEVVADVARRAGVPLRVQFGDDVVDQPVGQLDPVVARLGLAALPAVADLDELHGVVGRVGDHERRCGVVHGRADGGGTEARPADALLDSGPVVADHGEGDTASRDDLHAGHPAIGARAFPSRPSHAQLLPALAPPHLNTFKKARRVGAEHS